MTQKKESLFQYVGFRNLWVGQLVSQFGDVLHSMVFLWMVLEVTGRREAVGIVGAFEALPAVIFSMHSGVWADRYNRKQILLWTDWISTVFVLGFAVLMLFVAKPALWVICFFAFILKAVGVFALPARGAAIPRLVPSERLMEANALNSTVQNLMPLAGNVLAALVFQVIFALNKTFTYFITFLFNGCTFLVSALFMLRLPDLYPEREASPHSTLHEVKEGLTYIRKSVVLTASIGVSTALNFFLAPFMTAMVVVVQERFQGTPAMLAILETGFFCGMGIGALLTYRLKPKRVGLTFSLFLALAAVSVVPMGYVHSPILFWICNFLCGICIPPASIPLNTMVQIQTPDALRGRVSATMGMLSMLVMPIGTALSGLLLKQWGIEGTFLYMGLGLGIVPLLVLSIREFREVRLEELPSAQA